MPDQPKLTPFQNLVLDTLNSIGGVGTTQDIIHRTGFAWKAITNSLRSLHSQGFIAGTDAKPNIWTVIK